MANAERDMSGGAFDRYLLWKEYEKIAMHFNSLIIKLRSQSLGGVAVFATLIGLVAKPEMTAKPRWELLTGAFLLLSIFWVAVWFLDLGYYNRLLAGAVDALIKIEAQSSARVERITLSTTINEYLRGDRRGTDRPSESEKSTQVPGNVTERPKEATDQPRKSIGLGHNTSVRVFYAIVFSGVFGAFIFSAYRLAKNW
jgi:hypothetical protein